jgi:hypothetical protein
MSRKLGALAIALGILACSMELKTLLSGGHPGTTTVVAANGPAPMPIPPTTPPKSNNSK